MIFSLFRGLVTTSRAPASKHFSIMCGSIGEGLSSKVDDVGESLSEQELGDGVTVVSVGFFCLIRTKATGMTSLTPSSTWRSDAILDRSCRPYDSSASDEKVNCRCNEAGEGPAGPGLRLFDFGRPSRRRWSCLESESTSKRASIGVQSSVTASCISASFAENDLPELHTNTKDAC